MIDFQYTRADDVGDAVRQIAADPTAKFIAGGTNLIDLMKDDIECPTRLIDISRLPLKTVEADADGGLRIGALVPNSDLAYHPLIAQRYPLLASAILAGASQQLRNMASTGGNLLQRTRCYYFYDTATPCNKREPGSGCSAINGLNRMHAILGTSDHCIATHPSDMCVALAVLEANVHATGPTGARIIAFADFHRLPEDTPQWDTNLHPSEIITAVELPARGFAANYSYLKIRDRLSYAFALVSVAAGLDLDGTIIKDARFALGGVAHKPWRDRAAEEALIGHPADPATFAHAADLLLRDAKGFEHNSFKIDLARRAIVRALMQAAQGTPQSQSDKKDPVNVMAPYIGTPTSRVDGHAKVTGAARYAGEFTAPDLAHAYVVAATIAKGRILRIDAREALRVSGVIDILTHENRPPMAGTDGAYKDDVAPEGAPFRPLYDDNIHFSGQPIALIVAEEWEIARFAAALVRVDYKEETHATDLHLRRDTAFALKAPTEPRGDAETAFAASDVRHKGEYYIPVEHHNPIEMFASTAIWDGDGKLTIYDKTQGVQNVQRYIRGIFDMKPDDVRVVSPFVGGAFGSGLRPQYNAVLAALAALALRRSVRLVLTRQQMYALCYRPATIERVAIGAKAAGTLDAISHEAIATTSQREDFFRNDTTWSSALYKCANATYAHRLARLDLPTPSDMRAPGAATGVYALECAMDELAVALNIDPLELRYRTYSDRDQNEDVPYTSKQLRECYRQGAAAFGWDKRNPEPRATRDGKDLVGWGMATGVWEALQMTAAARIVLTANGHAEVSCATSDIGTGTYTIMAQVAADMLGLPLDNVSIKLGDSTLPQAPVEGGSWTAASVSNAIAVTADALRKDLLGLAKTVTNSPLAGANVADVRLADGKIVSLADASRAVSIADAMRQGGVDRIERENSVTFEPDNAHARNTHSAIFAEVKVDEQLGVIRVTRVVSAVAAGRILNTKTAGSQIMGSVVWAIGMALHEETLIDHNFGRFMNANIAEYHVPVNADVHDIQVIFVDEPDDKVNPLGIKGVGEIGIVGTAAAIANAIYHATGKRVRDLPITLDKLLR